jgi:hypothetical protein
MVERALAKVEDEPVYVQVDFLNLWCICSSSDFSYFLDLPGHYSTFCDVDADYGRAASWAQTACVAFHGV